MSDGKRIKLFVSVLNAGWVRRELVMFLLPRLYSTPGVEVVLDDFEQGHAHPICSNRSKITKRFLATDCDYLMMLDDDVVPITNPAELVHLNQDIIGCPAVVRKDSRAMVWVAYKKIGDRYCPLDIATIDLRHELLEVDAVGTGCIIIRRGVLEDLGPKAWEIEFDDDGVCKTGTDIVFCRRAKEKGYRVFCAIQHICEHFKELGMLGLWSMDFVDFSTLDSSRLGMTWGQFAIEARDWEFLKARFFELKPREILEFGSGFSTLLMAEHLSVDSLETEEGFAAEVESHLTESPGRVEIVRWDGVQAPDGLKAHYDAALIDGPRGKASGGPGREAAFRLAVEKTDHVFVHDSGRAEEVELQTRILLPDFIRVRTNGYQPTRISYWRRREMGT